MKPRSKPCASQRSARRARSPRCSRRSARCRRTSARPQGAAINLAKDTVTQALTARRDVAEDPRRSMRGWRPRPSTSRCRCARAPPRPGRIHPLSQVMDEVDHDLRRHGICDRRRSGYRDRRLQLHQAEFPRGPSGARDARHLLLQSEGGRLAPAAAHAHLAGAGAHHAEPEAADPRHLPGPHLSQRFRRDPYAACSIRSRASSSTRARISAT